MAGKYVPQIYFNPPYTDGGIEKATANLIGYEKTELLEPGESEAVTFEIAYEDMASYDSNKIKSADGAYVLEAGDYQINLCSDSHHVLDTYTATVDTDRFMMMHMTESVLLMNRLLPIIWIMPKVM